VFKKSIVFLLTLALILCVSAYLHVYFISDGGDGTLLWNGDKAYLFLDLGSFGYRLTCLQYIGQSFKELLGVGREPSDIRYSNVVFTIDPGNVHRYMLDNMRLSQYDVINGSILSGDLNTGILWKWDGDHLKRATAQDQRDLTKMGEARVPGPDYDDVGGWHKRVDIFSRAAEYINLINLKNATISLRATRQYLDNLSLELVKSDGTKETIWHLQGHSRTVSKAEYQRVFAKK
jgi:hypothetical protein